MANLSSYRWAIKGPDKTSNLPRVNQQFISEPGINAGLRALSMTLYGPVWYFLIDLPIKNNSIVRHIRKGTLECHVLVTEWMGVVFWWYMWDLLILFKTIGWNNHFICRSMIYFPLHLWNQFWVWHGTGSQEMVCYGWINEWINEFVKIPKTSRSELGHCPSFRVVLVSAGAWYFRWAAGKELTTASRPLDLRKRGWGGDEN